ncbi:MAG TPA: tRNA (adenine-N1)-methyltransferase [Candidatus Deferrimicrobium sp.]|nr:tRNA (adenine-N1)-methyltransferase [Candidatus Deferrimicrobium sp.]
MEKIIQNGDSILIVFDEKRRWIVQVKEGEKFHTNKGFINFDDVIGKPYGCQIQGSKQLDFLIFAPTPADLLFKTFRQTQIIYPKDAGMIIVLTGIGPGSQVVEAGAGSGGLTSMLAYFVRPDGKIYSYEMREEFLKKAQKNITRVGLDKFVEFRNKNILDGIEEKNMDSIILDLPNPWEVVPLTRSALKSGGFFASFSPQISQVQNTVSALREYNFGDIRTYELLMRSWEITKMKSRPETQMIGHTGFLTFARKKSDIETRE